jgi:DNA-binding SARP family transcriptional activator
MARGAVKAKQAQKRGAQPAKAAPRRARGRKRHSGGGNPNQQLFFMRLRRQAKPMYVILAVLFALTFAFLGVGSGSGGGLDQLFQGLNPFHHSGTSVSKAQKEVTAHPKNPKGFRDLATAYEAKADRAGAISALQSYTTLKPKDVSAWNELAGQQQAQAQDYLTAYRNAYQIRQDAAPSQLLQPTGKLGTAFGTNPLEQAAAQRADTAVNDLSQKVQLAYASVQSSYDQVTQLAPKDASGWLNLAQAAQTAGDNATAVKGYKRYLELSPGTSVAPQIKQLIKQLSPAPTKPSKPKK